jgi:hypothetical protein
MFRGCDSKVHLKYNLLQYWNKFEAKNYYPYKQKASLTMFAAERQTLVFH